MHLILAASNVIDPLISTIATVAVGIILISFFLKKINQTYIVGYILIGILEESTLEKRLLKRKLLIKNCLVKVLKVSFKCKGVWRQRCFNLEVQGGQKSVFLW